MATFSGVEDTLLERPSAAPVLHDCSADEPQPPTPVMSQWLNVRAPDILQALPTAIYLTDSDGKITFYNPAAAKLWGHHPELGKSEWCGSWRLFWPDGRPMPHGECPMAVTLRTRESVASAEAIAERPDGTRVPFLAYPSLLCDESGELVGAVNMLIDISDRKATERDQQLLSAIVDSSEDAIISKDLNGIVVSWNGAAERLFGYSAEEMIGQPIIRLIPTNLLDEETEILRRIRRGERIEHYDTIRRRKDGSLVDVSLTVSPVKGSWGEVAGASKIARDIGERRRAQEQQQLLLREMNHRVKNLFSLTSGVVTLTSRYAETPRDMAESVRERIGALARAHDLTLQSLTADGEAERQATTLHALFSTIASPYVDRDQNADERVAMSGPEVGIGGSAVTSVALLLHELATNAAKYGALNSSNGRVTVDWTVDGDALRLTWREQGGPPVPGDPKSKGFGTVLADSTVERHFGGQISRDWRPDGLVVHLSLSLARIAD